MNLYDITIENIDGKITTLKPYEGKVMLIVNVASRCGFTKQYAALEELYQQYKDRGLVVLGFPCNQFLHQEPGANAAIKEFAKSCFRISFPMYAKLDVKGKKQSALYAYLQQHIEKKTWIFIPWNFSKILVDKNGRVLKRFSPLSSMRKVKKAIEAAIV